MSFHECKSQMIFMVFPEIEAIGIYIYISGMGAQMRVDWLGIMLGWLKLQYRTNPGYHLCGMGEMMGLY